MESVLEWIFDAGRRTSRASYGQLSDTVVVKGMKNVSKDMKGCWAQSLSRSRGLDGVSLGVVVKDDSNLPRQMIEPAWVSSEQLTSTWCHPVR